MDVAYFAYGSNMLPQRLGERGVVLRSQSSAALAENHRLVFNKRSIDGSSKANLIPQPGASTWGALFWLDPSTLEGLDAAEGMPDHYRRFTLPVRTSHATIEAMSYTAQPEKILSVPDHPWDWYLALVLAGAQACPGMPKEWIEHLRHTVRYKPTQSETLRYREAVAQLASAGQRSWRDLLDGE